MPVSYRCGRDTGVVSSSHRSVASLQMVLACPLILADNMKKHLCGESLPRRGRWRIGNRHIETHLQCASQTRQSDRLSSEFPPPARLFSRREAQLRGSNDSKEAVSAVNQPK